MVTVLRGECAIVLIMIEKRMAKMIESEEAAKVAAKVSAQEKRAALIARRARGLEDILVELRARYFISDSTQ
jgi:sulfur transfer protein SufE